MPSDQRVGDGGRKHQDSRSEGGDVPVVQEVSSGRYLWFELSLEGGREQSPVGRRYRLDAEWQDMSPCLHHVSMAVLCATCYSHVNAAEQGNRLFSSLIFPPFKRANGTRRTLAALPRFARGARACFQDADNGEVEMCT